MNTNISTPSSKFVAYAVSAFVLILLSGIANASGGGPLQNPLTISNTSWSLSGNMQFTVYNAISGSSYNAVIGLNPPSNTGMSNTNQYYSFILNPTSSKIVTNTMVNPTSNNSLSFKFGNTANTLLVPGNIFGQWGIVLTITQVSNSSNTVSANANIGIMPPGTDLPTTFTMDYGGDQYNGTMVTNLSSVSKTFIVNESSSPLSVDNVLVQGGDDGIFVGNWDWTAPNATNIKSTEVNYLPWVGCKTTTKNGSPSFMNLTITGATSNSLSFNVAAGQCTNSKPASISYAVNAIGSNTIYGTWNIKSNEYEDSRGLSTPYDGDYDKPFTGVYNSNYYTKAPFVNNTNTTLSLTILPKINPTITASANSVSTGSSIIFTANTNGGESPYTYNFMIYNSSTNAFVANMLFADVASATNSFAYSPSSTGGYYANVTVTDSVPYSNNSTKVDFSVYSAQSKVQYSCTVNGETQLSLLSSSTTLANGPDTNSVWTNATPTYDGNSRWKANIPGATWIWDSNVVTQPTANQTVHFKKTFDVPGTVKAAILTIATDNDGNFSINSQRNPSWKTSDLSYEAATSFNITNTILSGNNIVRFNVTNIGQAGSTYELNPAGLLYNLSICYTPASFSNSDVHVSIPDSTIDVGQSETITASVTGGVTPYTSYVWMLNGNQIGTNSNLLVFNGNSSTLGKDTLNVIVTDDAGQKAIGTGNVLVNSVPSFGAPGLTIPDSTLNVGQSEIIAANEIGGTAPFTYSWTENSNPVSGDTSNQLTFNAYVAGTNTIGVKVVDARGISASTNGIVKVVNSMSFGAPSLTVPNSILEVGQSETITANVLGGTAPYTFAWTDNGNAISGTKNTITFTANSNNLGTNNFKAVVTDANNQQATGTGTVTVVNGISFGVPQITIPNSMLYVGQSETVTANVLGGVLPYNSFVWTLNGNKLTFPAGSNSITFNANASDMGLNKLQVVVTDADGNTAAGTGTANVVTLPTITLTPSTSSVTSGGSVTYTVTVNGGFGPFNVELYNITGSKQVLSNVTIASPGGSNTFTFNSGATGTFDYNAIATDTATNTLFNSTKASLTVNSAGCTSNCGGPSGGGGGGGGGGGNFVPTVKTSGNCTTISNFSQDNSERFTLNNQAFTVVENYINPTSAGVSVNGKAYLLDPNSPQNVLNTSGADYKITLKSISYLPIVDTITVELCYSSNQQQKQSSGAGSSMLVSLTTNKTISVQNGPVLLTGSITNGTTGPYKYDFIVRNSTGNIVFNKTNTNSKTSNSTVFTPLIPGIYTAAVKITTDGTTANSNKKDLTVSALQKTTTTIRPTTTATKVATAPPAAISNWIILLIIILIVIVLLAMYYYMNRRKNKSGKKQ